MKKKPENFDEDMLPEEVLFKVLLVICFSLYVASVVFGVV